MKIVQFNTGEYALRRGFWPFYMYKDRYWEGWWSKDSRWFQDCLSSNIEGIEELQQRLVGIGYKYDNGTPI